MARLLQSAATGMLAIALLVGVAGPCLCPPAAMAAAEDHGCCGDRAGLRAAEPGCCSSAARAHDPAALPAAAAIDAPVAQAATPLPALATHVVAVFAARLPSTSPHAVLRI